jgi:two-component system, chemotaxis family, CheB/CheR fusion protein
MDGYYETVNSKMRIYRSRRQAKHVAVSVSPQPATDSRARELHGHYAHMRRDYQNAEDNILERFVDAVSRDILPTAAIVDDRLELLHIIGNTEGYFRLPVGRPTLEIDKVAVRELAIPLSTGVQKVLRERRKLRLSGVPIEGARGRRIVDLRILPMPERRGRQPLAAVLIREREHSPEDHQAEAQYDLSKEAEQRIRDSEQELQFSRENLQATIEELETANEELYTVNTEYHAKILELTELNNDVETLLNVSQIGKLMLTEDLEVRRFSPRVATIFRLGESDVGRPLSHVTHTLRHFDPIAAMQGVLSTRTPGESEVQTDDGTWYLLRVVPYAVGPDVSSRLVASFVDITHVKRAEQEQETESFRRDTERRTPWPAPDNTHGGLGAVDIKTQGDRQCEKDNRYSAYAPSESSCFPTRTPSGRKRPSSRSSMPGRSTTAR